MPNVGENVEKEDNSYVPGGNVNQYSQYGKLYGSRTVL
jgi:hypothetical protein